MAYELAPLPYDYAALEPFIDTETMKIHHNASCHFSILSLPAHCKRNTIGDSNIRLPSAGPKYQVCFTAATAAASSRR